MAASRSPATQAASDYFNSLPIEQRKLIAPLLEEYHRMGIDEALRALDTVRRQLAGRARTITAVADDRCLFDSDEDLRAFLEATGNPQPDEPLGTCAIHGDYWTDDCIRCGR